MLETPVEIRCYACRIADGTFHMTEEDCKMAKKTEEAELKKIEAELKKVGAKERRRQHQDTEEFIKNLEKDKKDE